MDEDTYGVLDEALLRPPQLLGCERTPLLFVIFSATFLTVVVFGVTFPGLVAGIMLAAAGVMVLRRIAAYDPFWFAVQFAASRYPRHMPDVLPDTTIPRDLAFVGYDDPPSDVAVFLARVATLAIVVLPGGAAYALLGLVPALVVLAVMAGTLGIVIARCMPRAQKT